MPTGFNINPFGGTGNVTPYLKKKPSLMEDDYISNLTQMWQGLTNPPTNPSATETMGVTPTMSNINPAFANPPTTPTPMNQMATNQSENPLNMLLQQIMTPQPEKQVFGMPESKFNNILKTLGSLAYGMAPGSPGGRMGAVTAAGIREEEAQPALKQKALLDLATGISPILETQRKAAEETQIAKRWEGVSTGKKIETNIPEQQVGGFGQLGTTGFKTPAITTTKIGPSTLETAFGLTPQQVEVIRAVGPKGTKELGIDLQPTPKEFNMPSNLDEILPPIASKYGINMTTPKGRMDAYNLYATNPEVQQAYQTEWDRRRTTAPPIYNVIPGYETPSGQPGVIAGRTGAVNETLQPTEGRKTWQTKTAENWAKDYESSMKEGLGAQTNLFRIQTMKTALGKGYQGKMANLKANVGAYYESITGQPVEAASETQIAQAIANRIALTMVGAQVEGGGMPANLFSEADRNFVVQANANPALTPEANARLLDLAERTEKFKQAKAQVWTEYLMSNKMPGPDIYPFMEKRVSEIFNLDKKSTQGSKDWKHGQPVPKGYREQYSPSTGQYRIVQIQ